MRDRAAEVLRRARGVSVQGRRGSGRAGPRATLQLRPEQMGPGEDIHKTNHNQIIVAKCDVIITIDGELFKPIRAQELLHPYKIGVRCCYCPRFTNGDHTAGDRGTTVPSLLSDTPPWIPESDKGRARFPVSCL